LENPEKGESSVTNLKVKFMGKEYIRILFWATSDKENDSKKRSRFSILSRDKVFGFEFPKVHNCLHVFRSMRDFSFFCL
jgi:hypothetical protein